MRTLAIFFSLFLFIFTGSFSQVQAQASPWGTGSQNNVNLGQLTGQSVYVSHTNDVVPYTFDLNSYLANYTYNIYIPPSYDGSEPYGVVTFINSGNSGTVPSSWLPVLDERKLIMVGGNNIGNSIPVVTRIGVALAGSEIMKETLNIDTTRVYTSGNSGGARSCAGLMFFFPEKYTGMMSNCGSSYLRLVDQDYETHQPNSHYEYGLFQYNQTHLDYVYTFNHKYSMMTSFDDFREGDIMNIYHNGMEPDGFQSKILETSGAHCSTNAQHFRDAVNFVEHPHIDLVRDSFAAQPYVGNGFILKDANILNQQLTFDHNGANEARAYANDPIPWHDEKGAIIRTSISIDSQAYNKNSVFNIALLDLASPQIVTEDVGHELYDSIPNLWLSMVFESTQPSVYVLAENPTGNVYNDTLFSGRFTDWSAGEPMRIKYHLWNQEIRIEFGNHFDASAQVNSMSKLLDDLRSIRVRTDAAYWAASDFSQGTLLAFYAGKIDPTESSAAIAVDFLEVVVADSLPCNSVTTTVTDVHEVCDSLTWIDGNTYTASNTSAIYTLPASSGCDSTVVLNLTVLAPSVSTDVQVACNSYTWMDGNSYTSNNNTATWTIPNAAGCDSIITLDLTINTVDASITTIDATTLTANATGASYQWLDCDDNYAPIAGENGQTFIGSMAGNYAVEVDNNGCIDTSACASLTVGIAELQASDINIYPNPSNGVFTVDFMGLQGELEVFNLLGERVHQQRLVQGQNALQLQRLTAGIYSVRILSGRSVITKEIVIQP